jgi:PhnB protein
MRTLTSHLVARDPARAVDDAEPAWRRALASGATVFEPLHDAFGGDRTGQFIDPFGHPWALDQHPDEVTRLAADSFRPAQEA